MYILCANCIRRLKNNGEFFYHCGGEIEDHDVCDFCDSPNWLHTVRIPNEYDELGG